MFEWEWRVSSDCCIIHCISFFIAFDHQNVHTELIKFILWKGINWQRRLMRGGRWRDADRQKLLFLGLWPGPACCTAPLNMDNLLTHSVGVSKLNKSLKVTFLPELQGEVAWPNLIFFKQCVLNAWFYWLLCCFRKVIYWSCTENIRRGMWLFVIKKIYSMMNVPHGRIENTRV